jgi:5'-nucleotidase
MKVTSVISLIVVCIVSVCLTIACAAQGSSDSWPKRVLITNDNGVDDIDIIELARAFAKVAETYVVAPMEDRSGTTHYMTAIKRGMVAVERPDLGDGIQAYAVDGFPADCVLVALTGIMKENPPDLVISGINGGPNLGADWIGSGTIGAARVASFAGFPAIAVSGMDDDIPGALEAATQWVVRLAQSPIVQELRPPQFLTVSIPRIPPSEIKGIRVAKRADLLEIPVFNKVPNEGENEYEEWNFEGFEEREEYVPPNDSDVAVYEAGYIVVVLMRSDEHDYELLPELQDRIGMFPQWSSDATLSSSPKSAIAKVDKNEVPVNEAIPLNEVAVFLQTEGYENIIEIEFDHWIWEVQFLSGQEVMEYGFDPKTLKLLKKMPREKDVPPLPANGKSILEILEIVEARGYSGVFREISFGMYQGKPIWGIQIYDEQINRKIGVDPVSGEIIGEKQEKVK